MYSVSAHACAADLHVIFYTYHTNVPNITDLFAELIAEV